MKMLYYKYLSRLFTKTICENSILTLLSFIKKNITFLFCEYVR